MPRLLGERRPPSSRIMEKLNAVLDLRLLPHGTSAQGENLTSRRRSFCESPTRGTKRRHRHRLAGQSRNSRSDSARHQACRNYLQASAYYMHEQGSINRLGHAKNAASPLERQLWTPERKRFTQHKEQKQNVSAACMFLHDDCFERTHQFSDQLDRSRTLFAPAAR